jgi:hypothetical protein
MSNKHEIITLGQAISEFLDKFKLSDKVSESKVIASWPQVMGNNVAKLTHSLYFKGKGVLIVHLNSSVLRSELLMHRSRIVKNLNDHLGYEAVKEVVLK